MRLQIVLRYKEGNLAFQAQGREEFPFKNSALSYTILYLSMADFLSNFLVTHFRKFHFFLLCFLFAFMHS